jgi:hypothetical protein
MTKIITPAVSTVSDTEAVAAVLRSPDAMLEIAATKSVNQS